MEVTEIAINLEFDTQLLENFKSQLATVAPKTFCVLDIESPGGYVYILGEMADLIRAKKAEGVIFITNVDNYAYSAAFALFLLGDIKIVSDKAELMYHAAGLYAWSRLTAKLAAAILEELTQADMIIDRLLDEETEITPENKALLKKNTTFFDRNDLINLGVMAASYEYNL